MAHVPGSPDGGLDRAPVVHGAAGELAPRPQDLLHRLVVALLELAVGELRRSTPPRPATRPSRGPRIAERAVALHLEVRVDPAQLAADHRVVEQRPPRRRRAHRTARMSWRNAAA